MRPPQRFNPRQTAQRRGEFHDLNARHPRNVAIVFGDVADPIPNLSTSAADRFTQNTAAAGSHFHQSKQNLDEGTLACPVRSQKSSNSRMDIQIDIPQCPMALVLFGNLAQ